MFPTIFIVVLTINQVQSLSIPSCLTSTPTYNGVTIKKALPKQRDRSHVCQFTATREAYFLDIHAWKYSKGSLRVGVYGVYGSTLASIGRLETRNKTSGQTILCLRKKYPKYAVIISGTPRLYFTVKVQLVNQKLLTSGLVSLKVEKPFSGSMLFLFSPPGKNPIEGQLDITVKSQYSGNAVLRVSPYCDQVEKLGVSYPHKPTMSLTFEKQARITVSKVSRPVFSGTQPLFVGVLLQPQGESNNDKNFTIKIAASFKYHYAGPICFIVFVPMVGGILAALWAYSCFTLTLTPTDMTTPKEQAQPSPTPQPNEDVNSTAMAQSAEQADISPTPQIKIASTQSSCEDVTKAMWTVLKYHWVGHAGSRAYSYLTCIVGSILFVGAFQFVYENWNIMIGGNRDKCFYNDLCYRVGPDSDIPFNLMISNMAYIIHGVILAVTVWIMEAEFYVQAQKKARLHLDNTKIEENQNTSPSEETIPRHALLCPNINAHLPELSVPRFHRDHEKQLLELYAKAFKGKCSFSVGYAFAWALIFEGMFSLTYHLCPTRLTFQFDSAFMFVIAGLIVVSLFNGLFERQCRQHHDLSPPIQATSLFLYVIVPLYLLNYLGSVYKVHDRETRRWVVVVFKVLMVIWYILMVGWAGFKLFYNRLRNGSNTSESICKRASLFILTIVLTCIVFPWYWHKDLSSMFLFSSIAIAIISALGKIVLSINFCEIKYKEMCRKMPTCCSTWKACLIKIAQIAYLVVTLVLLFVAVYVFIGIETTDKTETPAHSRNLNKECAFLGFYDHHDIWHILSSFALLMGAFLVMYISD